MKIAVIDDYQDAFRKLACFSRLKGHDVIVFNDTEKDPAKLAERLKDADVVLLTQQRSRFPRAVTVAKPVPTRTFQSCLGPSLGHFAVQPVSVEMLLRSGPRY